MTNIPFSKIYEFEEHKEVKETFLKSIDLKIEHYKLHDPSKNQITNYHIRDISFQQMFEPYAQKYLNRFISEQFVYAKTIAIHNVWFQRYLNKDKHNWHVHPDVHFGLVYYLQLPDNSIGTKFEGYEVDLKEGQIFIFPAFMPHCSPINETNTQKTIIAANSSIVRCGNI